MERSPKPKSNNAYTHNHPSSSYCHIIFVVTIGRHTRQAHQNVKHARVALDPLDNLPLELDSNLDCPFVVKLSPLSYSAVCHPPDISSNRRPPHSARIVADAPEPAPDDRHTILKIYINHSNSRRRVVINHLLSLARSPFLNLIVFSFSLSRARVPV